MRIISEFTEGVRIAFEQVMVHKMRATLTALGVIIGIVAVVMMGTAIKGIDTGFDRSLSMIGDDIFYVEQWPWRDVGDDWVKYRNRPPMQLTYAGELNEIFANTPDTLLEIAVPTHHRWFTVARDDRSVDGVRVTGANANFTFTNTADFEEGRFFTGAEVQSASNVVVLGYDVADGLFPEGNPLDKQVTIRGFKFTVIGVYARQGSFLGLQSFDNTATLPLSTMGKLASRHWGVEIRVKLREGANKVLAEDELVGAMRRVRNLMPGEENDFEVNRTETIEEELGPIKAGIAIAGLFITGLSLFVGAIGIMNITFVSVKERTREIGTRRALGAPRRAILLQFLTEAVFICLIGGVIGLLLAFGVSAGVSAAFPNFPIEFSSELVVLALVVAVITGIFSGFAPAWTAARLDPASALRHE